VDVREVKLIQLLGDEEFERRQLELGDIIVDGDVHKIVIERKTVSDFAASLKDGRYRNQKMRLLEWKNKDEQIKKNVIYILEDKGNDNKDRAYWGAIVNACLRDNIIVIQSDGLVRTMELVLDMRKKVLEGKFEVGLEVGRDDIHLEGLGKKDYNTPQNCYLGQLTLIPGVSKNIGKLIGEKYGSMGVLIREVERNLGEGDMKSRLNFLSEIDIGGRRLGGKLAERICEYLTFDSDILPSYIKLREESKKKDKKNHIKKFFISP